MSFYLWRIGPRCLFTGAVDSGPAAPVLAAVELVAVSAVAWSCGRGVSLGLDGCEVRPCDPCARVRPCVPCVLCVSRLPPVSFYRYILLAQAASSSAQRQWRSLGARSMLDQCGNQGQRIF